MVECLVWDQDAALRKEQTWDEDVKKTVRWTVFSPRDFWRKTKIKNLRIVKLNKK